MNKQIFRFISVTVIVSSLQLMLTACSGEETLIDLSNNSYDEITTESVDMGNDSDEVISQPEITIVPEPTYDRCVVHVCGAVNNPGVYTLSPGARVVDAIYAAGGLLNDASGDALNQAVYVSDGQRIYVPTKEELESGNEALANEALFNDIYDNSTKVAEANSGLIDINRASAEELMTLPGIGEAKAANIIEFRTNNGGFASIEDITRVQGIKSGMFNKIKDKICVN